MIEERKICMYKIGDLLKAKESYYGVLEPGDVYEVVATKAGHVFGKKQNNTNDGDYQFALPESFVDKVFEKIEIPFDNDERCDDCNVNMEQLKRLVVNLDLKIADLYDYMDEVSTSIQQIWEELHMS